ncbi:MAG: hypothetical protein D8M57_09510 [Candidatus Scalindua sp. AMX11]|nr:MAG: hypothetical protein DWQ00_01120 [Candidatus Scalindua sp.]NOG82600.1 hypothetical protein [Planctomycetota bacterium]RZV78324.1 MAG: hypothetical protein EX341_11395 [Candidatus Scalindua sp. SCAELEC01]TDE65127.1 MAG: hypothetical protein D8M57_09510 [Candidatus Scalindua sp. AMX11]GJQ59524.1 MAG: hypothetical protein SCALA701_23250 [Candidatus Scalindua sp.]
MQKKRDVNSNSKSGISIRHQRVDDKIAKVIYDRWPRFVTQREIAHDLNVSQSLVSKRLSRWTSKKIAPLKMIYQERNIEMEKRLKDTYNLRDIVVLKNADYFVHPNSYINQIGKYASHVIVQEINARSIVGNNSSKEKKLSILASGGSCNYSTLSSLSDELNNTGINLRLSSSVALRSNSLIEQTPLYIASQLLGRKLNVEIANTYQLPKITNLYKKESLYEIVEQRIRTQKMLGIDNEFLQSDIVVLSLGSTRCRCTPSGFIRHISNLGLHSFLRKFDIVGEIACAPFGRGGFLFHYLVGEVFERKNGRFKYDESEQLQKLKKIANKNVHISKQDLIDAAIFFSSIITINFCEIEKSLRKQIKKPYTLLLVGGDSLKALPLKIILERWKDINVLDGLVTSENIAKDI